MILASAFANNRLHCSGLRLRKRPRRRSVRYPFSSPSSDPPSPIGSSEQVSHRLAPMSTLTPRPASRNFQTASCWAPRRWCRLGSRRQCHCSRFLFHPTMAHLSLVLSQLLLAAHLPLAASRRADWVRSAPLAGPSSSAGCWSLFGLLRWADLRFHLDRVAVSSAAPLCLESFSAELGAASWPIPAIGLNRMRSVRSFQSGNKEL